MVKDPVPAATILRAMMSTVVYDSSGSIPSLTLSPGGSERSITPKRWGALPGKMDLASYLGRRSQPLGGRGRKTC